MQVIVNEKDKLVEFWLTNAEKNDPKLRESLRPEFKRWKARKYQPVVYESGKGDLRESVLALLKKTVHDQAKREVEAEKAAMGRTTTKKNRSVDMGAR